MILATFHKSVAWFWVVEDRSFSEPFQIFFNKKGGKNSNFRTFEIFGVAPYQFSYKA